MKTYLLTYGIFQDNDVAPSILYATFSPAHELTTLETFRHLADLAESMRHAMRVAHLESKGAQGRLHWEYEDEFWSCDVRDIETDALTDDSFVIVDPDA